METQANGTQLKHTGSNLQRNRRRRALILLKVELVLELAALVAGFFCAFLISMRKYAIDFNTLWLLVDGLMALALVMLLVETWVRHRAGRMKKIVNRAVIFGFIVFGYLLFQVITGRLAFAS